MSKLIRSFLWINFSEIFFVLSGYLIHSFLARNFSVSEYGRYGLIVTLTTMTIVFIGDGVPKALSKFLAEFPQKEFILKKKTAIVQFFLVFLVSLLYFALAPIMAYFLKDQTLTPLIQLSTLIIPAFAAASFYNHYYNGLRNFKKQALQKIGRSFLRIFVILSLAYAFSINGALIGYALAPALVFLFSFILDKKKFSDKEKTESFSYQKILKFSFRITGFMLAYKLLTNVDLFLVKRLIQSDYLVGIYTVVLNIGQIPFFLFSSLGLILLPTISHTISNKNKREAGLLVKKSLRYLLILMVPIIFIIAYFAKDFITTLYSSKYASDASGVMALRIFVFGTGALTLFYVGVFSLNGSNRVKTSAQITWMGLLLNIVLNYFLIPLFGIIGASMATTFTAFILTFFVFYFMQKVFGKFKFMLLALKILFASFSSLFFLFLIPYTQINIAISKILTLYIENQNLKEILASLVFLPFALLFLVLYFFFLVLLKEIQQQDFLKLSGFLKRKKL